MTLDRAIVHAGPRGNESSLATCPDPILTSTSTAIRRQCTQRSKHWWKYVAHGSQTLIKPPAFVSSPVTVFSGRLIFCWRFFSFFRHEISELRRPICAKLLILGYNPGPKFRAALHAYVNRFHCYARSVSRPGERDFGFLRYFYHAGESVVFRQKIFCRWVTESPRTRGRKKSIP